MIHCKDLKSLALVAEVIYVLLKYFMSLREIVFFLPTSYFIKIFFWDTEFPCLSLPHVVSEE